MAVNITPASLIIVKKGTTTFTARGSGAKMILYINGGREVVTVFLIKYVSGSNGPILKIPNVLESDEEQYYCIVTNEWGRNVISDDVTLSIFGMLKFTMSCIVFSIIISCFKS